MDNLHEKTYQRGIFKNDIAFSLVTFGWLYWLCECRWFRMVVGGNWYRIVGGSSVTFWSRDRLFEGELDEVELWYYRPLRRSNDTAMGTLVRMLTMLGLATMLFGMKAFALVAPICGSTTLVVWLAVLALNVWLQARRGLWLGYQT